MKRRRRFFKWFATSSVTSAETAAILKATALGKATGLCFIGLHG
jgi:hypothetical protein